MDINIFIWSFLIVFMLHNLEEIIMIERWLKKTYPVVHNRIPTFAKKEMEQFRTNITVRFAIAVLVLFIVSSTLILLTITKNYYFLFLGLNTFFALNMFTHPIQSLLLKCYVPGLWSTLFIIIPYNLTVFPQLYDKDILHMSTILGAIVVTILFIPMLLISHKIAEKWA